MHAESTIRHWVLKTREGRGGRDYWNRFLSDGVIAIGWNDIDVSPDEVGHRELLDSLMRAYRYSEREATIAANTIRKFINIGIGDKILLCQGYAPIQYREVHIYGVALVDKPFRDDRNSDWWRFDHKANIQSLGAHGVNVPKDLLVRTLHRESLLMTLHEIGKEGFEQLLAEIHQRYRLNVIP